MKNKKKVLGSLKQISGELQIVNDKYLESQEIQGDKLLYKTNSAKLKSLMGTSDPKNECISIQLYPQDQRSIGLNARTKLEAIRAKLKSIQNKIGGSKIYNISLFVLDDLDADTGSDMVKEHLSWI